MLHQVHEKSTFENPPTSNTGGLPAVSESATALVVVNGKVKEIPLKRGSSTAAFIDTLTITMPEDVFLLDNQLGTEEEIVISASAWFEEIMGYGFYCEQSGRNGYAISYKMGNETENYGFFAIGGKRQRNTVCLFFTGVGLVAAKAGWEHRLHEFLSERAPMAKITRIDLAHDFLEGQYTPDEALKDWQNGLYTARHTKPIAECVGGDWLEYRGTGKTLYIGSRKSASRFGRIYEKGKQLGDPNSEWVRVELEMHNRDIVIPHDVLLEPGKYLTGAYPAFEQLFSKFNEAPTKAERIKKAKDVGIGHVVKYASMQVAPCLNMMQELGLTPEEIIKTLKDGKDKLPKRLRKEAFDCADLNIKFLHEFGRFPRSADEILEKFGNEFAQKPRMKHRSYQEYEALKDSFALKDFAQGGYKSNHRSYEEYMYDRFATPTWILNR